MSVRHPHHGPGQGPRPTVFRLMGPYAAIFACLLLIFLGLSAWVRHLNRDKLVIPDERAASARLLAQQFTGPRYFHVPELDLRDAAGVTVQTVSEPHITVVAAKMQMERIAAARKLSPDQVAKLYHLLDRLTEPPASRLVGVEHINLARLNLALDAL